MATFVIILNLIGFLLPLCVPVLIFVLLKKRLVPALTPGAVAPTTSTTTSTTEPPRRSPWRWLGLIPVAGFALFTGLMITSIGGVLHPPLLKIATPLVCDGPMEIVSSPYSYKPGQHGTSIQPMCVDPASGERRNVTFPVLAWTTAIFSAIAFVPILLVCLFLMRLVRPLFRSLRDAVKVRDDGRQDMLDGFRQALQQQQLRTRASDGGHVEDRLRDLARLRDRGLIDDDDYRARKDAILAQL